MLATCVILPGTGKGRTSLLFRFGGDPRPAFRVDRGVDAEGWRCLTVYGAHKYAGLGNVTTCDADAQALFIRALGFAACPGPHASAASLALLERLATVVGGPLADAITAEFA